MSPLRCGLVALTAIAGLAAFSLSALVVTAQASFLMNQGAAQVAAPGRLATLSVFLATGPQLPIPYRARRRLEAVNRRFDKEASLEVTTEFDPDRGFSYAVLEEAGSSLVRNRVLRAALETEAKTIASGATQSALTPENYFIADAGEDERGLVRLRLQPRRKDQLLVDGFVLVTPGNAEVVRIEGRLAKNPSFWITRVEIVRRYESVLGFNVPVEVSSEAQMRIFGPSSFRMRYRYESIHGIAVPASAPRADVPPLARALRVSRPPEEASATEPDDPF